MDGGDEKKKMKDLELIDWHGVEGGKGKELLEGREKRGESEKFEKEGMRWMSGGNKKWAEQE